MSEYQDALTAIGGLSKTSKMPGYSWSISASLCKTGGKLRDTKGSTCEKCYAMKGMYNFPNVKASHERKLDALKSLDFVPAFSFVLNFLVKRNPEKYAFFRWHDSGDLQNIEHLMKINSIATRTPDVHHWLPTREPAIVKEFLDKYTVAPNLTIRVSAPMVGTDFKKAPMGLPYSTVGFEGESVVQCPAYTQEGKCGDCRMCWDKETNINYPLH